MWQIFYDRLLAWMYRRTLPAWARRPDPFLPRLRPSYRWWVRW